MPDKLTTFSRSKLTTSKLVFLKEFSHTKKWLNKFIYFNSLSPCFLIRLSLSDYIVTKAGFASELGADFFFNIKSRFGKIKTHAVVIVATIRALKYHGGLKLSELTKEDLSALKNGFDNLDKHIENMRIYGFNPGISINKFDMDTQEEINLLSEHCDSQKVKVALNESWGKGGKGAIELAEIVIKAANESPAFLNTLYELDWSFENKIETIAKKMYGEDHVEYTVLAKQQLKKIEELNLGNMAVCIAKTQKSFSDNEHKKAVQKDSLSRSGKLNYPWEQDLLSQQLVL
jgi:formate--tetrahydrofolate ligase